jgi:hypothetical protein
MPRFDSSGFESYEFQCSHCGATLAGIVDPYDDRLLLNLIVGPSHRLER